MKKALTRKYADVIIVMVQEAEPQERKVNNMMKTVLRCGEIVFEGTYAECLDYCKENGLMQYVPYWNDWMFVCDAGIV